MSKWVAASVLNGALAVIAGATRMDVVDVQPASRAAVVAATLASVVMAGGDFTQAAGTGVSARKVTTMAKTGVSVTAPGNANHVALCDGVNLLYVTTCTTQVLTAGNTLTFPAWTVEFGDPTP